MLNLIFLILSLFLVIKSSDYAIKHASGLARILRLPKYAIGFLVVAIISILPETFIAINAALDGIPSFGLGALFGSNVADLTLVFTIVLFATKNGIKVSSKILESNRWYPFFIALPIFAGFDGHYSRPEGIFLIVAGLFFYYLTFRKNEREMAPSDKERHRPHIHIFYLLMSMAILLFGAHLTVKYGVALANSLAVNSTLIAMLIVGLGTTLPELIFSLRAIKNKGDGLALGDVLGTVISDATIAVGILALINPFSFPQRIIYVTAAFMVVASLILFSFMRSGKILTKKEGLLLFLYYIIFVIIEYLINK
jgi:cation:H+ antiporter